MKLKYLLNKFTWMLLMLLLITFITFIIFYAFPADPALRLCGKPCTPEKLQSVKQFMQIDKPVLVQFLEFLRGIIFGRTYSGTSGGATIICDAPCLGYSFQESKPVTDLILARVGSTFSIAIGASILAVIIGVGLGILAARQQGRLTDKLVNGFCVVGISSPAYLVGLLAVAVFGFRFGLFPSGGYVPLDQNPFEWFRHLLLPWLILALITSPSYIKLTRSGLLTAFGSDYYRTARSKGLSGWRLFINHGLRNCMLEVVTLFGVNLGGLLSGAVLTETVFSMNGLGRLMIQAVGSVDISVILGCTLFASFAILLANFTTDAVYFLLDPRVAIKRAR
jgi:peptide/nickel transport system permease protein